MKRYVLTVLAAVVALGTIGGNGCRHPEASFFEGLKQCAETDITSDKILYFGPSNSVGPGSGWREAFGADGKHADFRLRFAQADLPEPKNFIELSKSGYSCQNGKSVTFELNADVSASVSTLPLTAALSNDLKTAKSVTVTVGGMGWDQIKEIEYEDYFKKQLGAGDKYYEDMNNSNRLVLYRALAVKDLTMDYTFSSEDYAKLTAKYSGPLGGGGSGNIGGNVSINWKGDNKMAITAPGNSWVLGELGKFSSMKGFAASGMVGPLTPISVPQGAVVTDLVK